MPFSQQQIRARQPRNRREYQDSSPLPRFRANSVRRTFSGTRLFDRTLQKSNIWLKELGEQLQLDSREASLSALRATLQALRDLLPIEEMAQLGSQLPVLIRGLYYENWDPHHQEYRVKHREDFYALVEEKMGSSRIKFFEIETQEIVLACFDVLTRNTDVGEIKDVRGTLPKCLHGLVPVLD